MATVIRPKRERSLTGRILSTGGRGFTEAEVSAILKMKPTSREIDRMNSLVRKNRESVLTEAERNELDGYVSLVQFLNLAYAKVLPPSKSKKATIRRRVSSATP